MPMMMSICIPSLLYAEAKAKLSNVPSPPPCLFLETKDVVDGRLSFDRAPFEYFSTLNCPPLHIHISSPHYP